MTDRIRRVGVVGAGTMGAGIAQIIAGNGIEVAFVEVDEAAVETGRERIRNALDRDVRRERLSPDDAEAIADRITGSPDWSVLAGADLVIEAVPEQLALKQRAFEQIDAVVGRDTIIATNTSSLPVMDIAVHASRPNRVLGFHFFNPAPVMKLIELVRTVVTDESVVDTARSFAESIGKSPVVVGDRRGFIANQLLFPYLNQAVELVESGYATKEDVDAAMRFGAGLPMGPIALVDLVGLDTMVGIMDAIHSQFDDPRFAPRPILKQLVEAGYRGRKSGRGFYTYQRPGSTRFAESETEREPADPGSIASWGRVGVVGTGTMATGIAEVCARTGHDVVVRGRSPAKADAVVAGVGASLQRMVDKGRLDGGDREETLARITSTDAFDDLAGCDLVIEAVAEDLDVKREVFAELADVLDEDCVLATTTSSLPVIACAMVTDRPERVVGLHFFNPAAVMQLVEVVPTVRTDPAVVEAARAFVDQVGKVGVLAGDRAGFIVNALLFPYLNDAIKMLDSHYATAEEIDTAMKLGCGYPMGPFELLDIVGLDVSLAIIDRLHAEFREPSYAAAPLLRHMVHAGFSGRKAGRGFHVHES
ncbi:3-hydroxybutyryl-CoA dehydrogenase [Salsipaludibacter albus]|uniref:3-hydroxyacyl-CoA dehydrogenase family protein n=1 Tax=Salsipaludibacter albus TaxID=2849650 RepID=UPI00308404F6|nr:NAD(P)-binding domain-containing protein [Salsipaludibacter albus]